MKPAGLEEYLALVQAALVLTLTLVVCYMCIQLYRGRRKDRREGGCRHFRGGCRREGFWPEELYRNPYVGDFRYAPACRDGNGGDRRACRGLSTGAMPDIESGGCGPGASRCCDALGLPP